jgi:opacity protein-like surface antigen
VKKVVVVAVVLSSGVGAAEPAGMHGRLGAELVLGVPRGGWSEDIDGSGGALFDYDWGLGSHLSLTLRTGLIYHLADIRGMHRYAVPIWGGAKGYILTGSVKPFVAAEIGGEYNRAEAETISNVKIDDSKTNFGLGLGGGVEVGAFVFRAWLQFFDLGATGRSTEVLASAGCYFVAL